MRWTGFRWLEISFGGCCCKHGNEISSSVEVGNFLSSLMTASLPGTLRGAVNV